MLKTLSLNDDLDPVVVVSGIEEAFDVTIGAESEAVFTVGQMFDLLRAKIPAGEAGGKCASAMAFYRLRRALNNLRLNPGRVPSSGLSQLPPFYTKATVKMIERDSGLRMPRPDYGLLGKAGIVVQCLGVAGFVGTLVFAAVSGTRDEWAGIVPIAFLLGGLFVGLFLLYCDPGRLPSNCTTLGALAAKAARLSVGRLIKSGADAGDQSLWKALVDLLSEYANVPADQISRDTYFLKKFEDRARTAA